MDCLYCINAEGAQQKELTENYVELRDGDFESAEVTMSGDKCCYEVDGTDNYFIGKDKTKWGKVKSSTHSMQMAKYCDKITWNYRPSKGSHYTL